MTEPKTLSAAAWASMNAPETAEEWLWLLTIEHPDLTAPIRLARNWRVVESRGEAYVPYPFTPQVEQQEASRPPTLTLQIGNVSRLITAKLEEIAGAEEVPKVTLEVVLASQPSVVEYVMADFEFRSMRYDRNVITANLAVENFLTAPYPDLVYSTTIAPGAHK